MSKIVENQPCQFRIICIRQWDGFCMAYSLTFKDFVVLGKSFWLWKNFGNSVSGSCTKHYLDLSIDSFMSRECRQSTSLQSTYLQSTDNSTVLFIWSDKI